LCLYGLERLESPARRIDRVQPQRARAQPRREQQRADQRGARAPERGQCSNRDDRHRRRDRARRTGEREPGSERAGAEVIAQPVHRLPRSRPHAGDATRGRVSPG